MLDVPFESMYTLVALSVGATLLVGVVAGLPTTPAPDAQGVAETIDDVAVAEYDATAEVPLGAAEIRLDPQRIGLRNDGGVAHATLAFGPVTPATLDSRLGAVATGAAPSTVFDSPAAFRKAAAESREVATVTREVATATRETATATRDATAATHETGRSWRSAPESLVVRHVTWEGVDVTIVAA
ncbi:hypothetical protein C453_05899 [Haloferax elongans ATCC BAA-1513]|uniref:Uncharacterized protein n=1 Tax=Haloferax elongans ATCC BAA-1513 TaxID=1230453 RepID=M0HSH0_HALEO|nr:hypothetical protein [Haloferax elongans]ELZ86647.1 hypothetical protein C453_05899 [Haloferax elongans ATCC BAA-1513]